MVLIIVLGLALGFAPQRASESPAVQSAPPSKLRSETPPSATPAAESCDCETQRPEVLAIVKDIKIPTRDVEAAAEAEVAPIKGSLDAARERELQTLVADRLIEHEAKQRGTTRIKLLQEDIYGKVLDPTEDELRTFYDRNKLSAQGSYEQLKPSLLNYIRAERQRIEYTLLIERLRSAAKIQITEPSPKAPTTTEERAKVLAVVNGAEVTLGEVEDQIAPFRYEARRQIYEVEKQVLEDMIAGVFIGQEAARRGVAVQVLLDSEVAPKVRRVDAFEASKFYNANKERFNGRAFAEVKDELLAYLQEVESAKARRAFADGLRKGASVQTFLIEPAPPTFTIDVAGRPALEFSDFQCPKCAVAHATLEEIAKQYGDKVRIVARYYPLEQHMQAFKAAEAAEAAHEQGKYWEYATLLFASQSSLSPEKFKEFASQLNLDRAKFDAALDSAKFAPTVQRDLNDAQRLGALGTPAYYVNGRMILNTTPEGVKAAIDAALAEAKR
jgi:predicted DsbA family dithiol-disulfide isomerase